MTISKRVPLEMLRPGVALTAAIADPAQPRVKLLGKGIILTEAFLAALRKRGVESVILANADIAALTAFSSPGRRSKVPPAPEYCRSIKTNDYSDAMDDQIEQAIPPAWVAEGEPLADSIETPTDCGFADGLAYQWACDNNERVNAVTEFFDDTVDCRAVELDPLYAACRSIISMLKEDKDALVCLSSTPHESEYPSRHGIHLAGIAMAIGLEMGLDEPQLSDLGLGCLIHDVGMRVIGVRMFQTKSKLSPTQLNRLADHPVLALEIAAEYGDQIPERAKLVAYQIHERLDGSGYPRGWQADKIHPLAKIAGVADAYVGMLATRSHRLAIQGYYVMANLLEAMKTGKFDAAVIRALLNAASLYPLGSYVRLNNECVGRVIRSGKHRFLEPTVEMWHEDHRDREPTIVNLRHEPTIRITESMPATQMPRRRAA